ncbi:Rrf2 family transcriptional regulator [Gracilibacillus salitolerans]|uniref:Rrf2 family transcriptional regulator n=1 Tax=Gracilibacillus salitolerans TaxID=2663022 RepID=A0A5Q2TF38_9BACI|nr:Rrf2 family transcriptional regulator [Gracilibacillus salitolerans]QGH33414.1 Rrf2 family transcriptional regulator [Gracilibacillus salitolerans]
MSYSTAFSQALSIVVYTAVKIEEGYTDYVSARQLSENMEMPNPTVVKILQSLNRFGLITTKEGARGGIRLAKAPEEITVLDVFSAIELDRPLFKFSLPSTLKDEKSQLVGDNIEQVLSQAESDMKSRLAATKISDLF